MPNHGIHGQGVERMTPADLRATVEALAEWTTP